MPGSPFTNGIFQAFDSNGNPLSGGLLYTYAAGTTTPQSTYTDSTLVTPNANPVVLNGSGGANVWLSPALGNYKFVLKDSSGVIQWTVDNWPPSAGSSTTGGATVHSVIPGGRLTLTSNDAAPAGDVIGATTIYYLPYNHDDVPLYDGAAWMLSSIGTGLSQTTTDNTKSPAAVVANHNYDLFVWNDAGTIRLSRGYAWATGTTRGTGVGTTELVQQDGKWVNKNAITNGPAALTGLYVGSVRADGSSQLNDSSAGIRLVWNTFNRVPRPMTVTDATATWIYNTAAWRQANANTANQLDVMIGLNEDAVSAHVAHCATAPGGVATVVVAGIGLDVTNAPASGCIRSSSQASANANFPLAASWEGFPGIGFHFLTWLEYGGPPTAGNLVFTGTSLPTQNGIVGEMRG